MADEEAPPRQEFEFSLTTTERGKITIKIFDRITVDDILLHLINQEIFMIVTRKEIETDVDQLFKDFLLKENFTAGQN